jgi:hypothetical protein
VHDAPCHLASLEFAIQDIVICQLPRRRSFVLWFAPAYSLAMDSDLRWRGTHDRWLMDGFEHVLAAVNVIDHWPKLNFFFLNLQELDGKPRVQAIREGVLRQLSSRQVTLAITAPVD